MAQSPANEPSLRSFCGRVVEWPFGSYPPKALQLDQSKWSFKSRIPKSIFKRDLRRQLHLRRRLFAISSPATNSKLEAMDVAQVGKTEWLQIAGHVLDSSSYILSQHNLQGLPIVFYRQGYLAQEEERGTPAELQSLYWQAMGQHAAYVTPAPVADMESCTIGACEYRARSPELGRGKRRRGAPEEPFLRLLLVRQGMPGGGQMGVWVEHHVHLNLPDFIITRDRFNASTSLPFLYGQRVKMVWKDAADPTRGEWYEGTVSRSEEWGPGLPPGATWEGVSVMWDIDRSITHVSPWELVRLPHQQQHQNGQQQHDAQQLQHAQQQQHDGVHNPMQFAMGIALVARQLHGRPHPSHMPLFHPGLQLRPGGQAAAGKGPANGISGGVGLGMGHSVVPGTSLAEPGSGVSADTPGTLPWGQPGVMPPERALNSGTNAEAQAASQAAALSRPHTADAHMTSPPTHIHTDPQIPPLSLSPGDIPPLFTGLSQRPLSANSFAASRQDSLLAQGDNPRALGEDSLAALRSRASWGLGSGPNLGLSAVREEGADELEGYQGVTVLPGRAGDHIYMAVLRDDNNAEQTCGAFATAVDAAKAHDTEALRVYGPAAEAMLNFPIANYPDVLAELRSRRRTNSTDEMDTPASLPDSPWMWELRSQSLTAIGAALSPSAQRQLIASGMRQTPAGGHGAKHLPMKPSHASSSRLAALVDQMPVPDEQEIGARLDGENRRPAGNKTGPSRASPRRLATAVGNIPLGDDSPSHSAQPNKSSTVSGVNEQDVNAESEDTDEEERLAAQAAGARRSLRVQKRKGSLQRKGSAAPAGNTTANPDEEDAREGGEEEWAPSPVARGKRNLRVQAGMKERGGAADARAAAARRPLTGGRKRSEKLTDFPGVTLKNGRIAVMLWNPVAKKPIHLGYWPSSLAAARMADKARLAADFRRNVKAEDLNFPQVEYSPEELPASIAQLAEFIKEEQSAARRAESVQKAQEKGTTTRRPANPAARSMDTTRARFSHYLGVSWNKQEQQWQARFHKPDGGSHLVGGFKEEEEAGQAYDQYALHHYGNAAVRNFPPSTYTGKPADDAEAFWRIRQHAVTGGDRLSKHVAGRHGYRSHRSNAQGRPSTAGTATTASVSSITVPERSGSVQLHRQAAGQEMTSPQTREEDSEAWM
ncbi:hypothetical protein WJX77_002397 [Trebouxia sp. C0004]